MGDTRVSFRRGAESTFPHRLDGVKIVRFLPLLLAAPLVAQTTSTVTAAGQLPAADRELARAVFTDLIDTNTSHSVGSTTDAAQKMAARLQRAGFTDSDLAIVGPNPRRMNLVVRYRGNPASGKRPALFICHLDVVEAPRSEWQTDPFVLTEKDGYFYGRGTQDIKEGDAGLVVSLIRLKREGYVPDRDFIVALTADEEGGPDNGVDWLLKNRRDLLGNPEFVINPDAGGVNSRHGKVVNVSVEATEKLYADFQLAAEGPGGHSSLPPPDTPIYHLARALVKVQEYKFPVELNPVTTAYIQERLKVETGERAADLRSVLGWNTSQGQPGAWQPAAARLSKSEMWNATLRTTCVATILHGGEAPNAIPAEATANVNCRILPGHSMAEVQQQLVQAIADPAVSVKYVNNGGTIIGQAPETRAAAPPPPLPAVFGPLHAVVNAMWPGTPVIPDMETGASDSIYTIAAGIPSYGINGFQIDEDNLRFHARDERLGVESYYAGVQFQYLLMKAIGGNK